MFVGLLAFMKVCCALRVKQFIMVSEEKSSSRSHHNLASATKSNSFFAN